MDNTFRVLIIGGGNCGLAIATGLKKAGIHYTVFERDTEHDFLHKARDWGMLLHWGTEYLGRVLPDHMQKRIKEPRVDPSYEMIDPIPYINGDTGEVLARVPTDVITRVSRKKLRRFLTEGEGLSIEYGKTLQSMKAQGDCVTVAFKDGSQAEGNMVIGCDGSRSRVREYLVGAEAAKLEEIGLTMINYVGSGYTAEQAQLLRSYHPIVQLSLDIPDPEVTTEWLFQVYTSWWGPPFAADLQEPAARLAFVKGRMSQFCEPYRTAFTAISDDALLPIYAGQQWAPPTAAAWDNRGGKVTLAGDAAHSMLPHRGQGLNNAMRDASDLVDAVKLAVCGKQTLAEVVTAYEAEMRPRGAREVALSLEQARKTRDWETVMEGPVFKQGYRRA
ncbi:hypothetical protein LTR36_004743 [Oleoguttula mirabilis]|uniref:FAD-binding domain-containing protein n=1 Tax=Oleoguttula mirabilis TaxID=1507867 RepID=A0AAV9JFA0_9PEZI|nr:hypothetical protein LTR36_004743 [Oleoguttula mirabilis]